MVDHEKFNAVRAQVSRDGGRGARVLSWVFPPAEAPTSPSPAESAAARFRLLRRREEGGEEVEAGLAGGTVISGSTAGKRVTQSRASVREVAWTMSAALRY